MQKYFLTPLQQWGPASFVSLSIHTVALYLILMLPAIEAPGKKVVQVEAISLTQVTPKPEGGHAGGSGAPPAPEPPKTVAKPPLPPKPPDPKPKPKPVVKPAPEPEPIPPKLAMPKPAPPLTPPRPAPSCSLASSSSRPNSYASGSGAGQGSGSGSGLGTGSGSGVGSGRGSGSGSGCGTGSGAGSGSALQGYLHQVRSLLERNKIYPPQARSRNEQGTVVVRFTISSDGSIGGVSLSSPSGQSALDQAALETVNRVRRFPPFPEDLQKSSLTVQVPLAYRLQGG